MTTFLGDTGLWFVPTAETLPTGSVSFSVQRTEQDFRQGNTNVSFWPVTGAVGAGPVEVFGSMRLVTRIDRDTAPLLFTGPTEEAGGLVNQYPNVRESWSGTHPGDLYLGAKLNILSQRRQQPMALAVRGTVKFPTASKSNGLGTGEYDGYVDLVGSGEAGNLEIAGFGGIALRGDPGDISLSDGIRWGGGVGFPTRKSVRFTGEVTGEWPYDHAVTAPAGVIVGTDGSLSPQESRLKDDVTTAFGVTWQHPRGLLLGAALTYTFGMDVNDPAGQFVGKSSDGWGMQFRIGFHRGVRIFAPPPALAAAPPAAAPPPPAPEPAPVAAPPPPPAANRVPTVRAACDPCTVTPGQTAMLRATTTDPDGDPIAVRWSTTGGTVTDTRAAATQWRAETAPGIVTFTVTAEDGRGGVSTDTISVQVRGETLAFEDVHFDFDSYRLRRDALTLLDPVIAAMKERPAMRLQIEGHTCNVGTAEYNLALGERRANAVRDYLVDRGIAASRVSTVSFGEERPGHDNSQEPTRKLNRRAVLEVTASETSTTQQQ